MSDAGVHNDNLEISAARILEGGTWKHQRGILLLPAAEQVSTRCAMTWMNIMTPPNQPFVRMAVIGDEVGVAYSTAIDGILQSPELRDFEYVLTVEHDNAVPPDGYLNLIKQMDKHPEYAAISAIYWTKGEGGVPQIWGDIKDPVLNFRPQPPVTGKLVECYGIGMGFALWRLSMFKDPKLARPLFKTKCSAEDGVGTQDLSFWSEARKHGYRCAVDCSILVGHWDATRKIMW